MTIFQKKTDNSASVTQETKKTLRTSYVSVNSTETIFKKRKNVSQVSKSNYEMHRG